jgi:hypothetical protein
VAESSTITEWSMTRLTGTSGLIFAGVTAQLGDGIAHGGKVDHAGHAGVLQQHARGGTGSLVDLAGFFCQSAIA